MLKTDFKKEIKNGLKIIREAIDEGVKNKKPDEALKVLDREMKGLIGLDINTIDTLSFNSITELLSRDRELNADRYVALGEILKLRSNLCMDNLGEKFFYYKKSLKAFYIASEDEELMVQEYLESIRNMINELSEYELNLDEMDSLFKGHEMLKEYDNAEDVLFNMLKDSNNDEKVVKDGIDFYERLLNKSEEELERGNLPMNEVKESLKEIKAVAGL